MVKKKSYASRCYQGSNLGFGKMIQIKIPSDDHYTIAPYIVYLCRTLCLPLQSRYSLMQFNKELEQFTK